MKTRTRVFLAASIVLAPILFGVGDQLRMTVSPPGGEWGPEATIAELEGISANAALWTATSYIFYIGALLAIPALVAIWRLSVGRAPRWAWAGAIIATLGVFGQAVHLMGYFAFNGALATYGDHAVAADILLHVHEDPFGMAIFAPFLIGTLAIIPQTVGLWRARVIPVWAAGALGGGLLTLLVAGGSYPVPVAIWMVLTTVGLVPAALAMLRYETEPEYSLPPAPARVAD